MKRAIAVAFVAALAAAACGGGSGNPLVPDSGSAGPSGVVITILANGTLDAANVTIAVGQSVTFINNDTRGHEMSSNPHPDHTDCPSINAVRVISPGQTKLTNAFTASGSCGFHDHGDPDNNNLKGRITIQ